MLPRPTMPSRTLFMLDFDTECEGMVATNFDKVTNPGGDVRSAWQQQALAADEGKAVEGYPHSKPLPRVAEPPNFRQGVECARPLALWRRGCGQGVVAGSSGCGRGKSRRGLPALQAAGASCGGCEL